MNKHLKIDEKKQIKIQGILQNCYRRDVNPDYRQPRVHDTTIEKYVSLERKQLPNGFVEEIELKDYPINAASVTSYADGADYRNDPAQAVANAPKRVNLGDVTEIQDFLKNDPLEAVRVFRNVAKALENYDKTKAQPTVDPVKTEKDGEQV